MNHRRTVIFSVSTALALTASLGCQTGPTPLRAPQPAGPQQPSSADPAARFTFEGLTQSKRALSPHTLVYLQDSAAWPQGSAEAAPIVAVATTDSDGALWLLHDRPGSSIGESRVFAAIPSDSRYPRPGAALGELVEGALKAPRAFPATNGDRLVLAARTDGPVSRRIVAAATAGSKGWEITPAAPGGQVILVRTGSMNKAQQDATLNVRVEECDAQSASAVKAAFESTMKKVALGGVTLSGGAETGPLELRLSQGCEATSRLSISAPAGQRLLRTPFWSPDSLSFGPEKSEDADPFQRLLIMESIVAVVAAYRAELPKALLLSTKAQPDPVTTLVTAALALEAGWTTDVRALLDAPVFKQSLEGRLLLAGAAHKSGDNPSAAAHLDWLLGADSEPTSITGQQQWLWARVAMSRAAVSVAMGNPKQAETFIEAAITKTPSDLHKATLLLGLAEIHLAAGDLNGFVSQLPKAAKRLQASGAPRRDLMALITRYKAMVMQLQGDAKAAMTLYTRSAELYEQAGQWAQAASMWRFMADSSMETAPDLTSMALDKALGASTLSLSPQSVSDSRLAAALTFAIRSASSEKSSDTVVEIFDAAIDACRRAERFDQEATAVRYKLLTLPAAVDINQKATLVIEAIKPALAGTNKEEITMLLSLHGRLEAARFNFEQAQALLEQAHAFAVTTGDPELVAMIKAELDQISEDN
jgi:tetratricopeptide (TPR) repeat protein